MNPDHDFSLDQLRNKLNQSVKLPDFNSPQHTPAAVLVPFIFEDGKWFLLFTKRTNGVATHQGEISFPGGSADPSDQTLVDTALRETNEEIGIAVDEIQILGSLDPYPTISNFCVLPIIGIVNWPTITRLNPEEVDKLIQIPVEWLKDSNNWYESDYTSSSGITRRVVHYQGYAGEHLWGLTAGIARKVLELV